jgi:hypothetical protein
MSMANWSVARATPKSSEIMERAQSEGPPEGQPKEPQCGRGRRSRGMATKNQESLPKNPRDR